MAVEETGTFTHSPSHSPPTFPATSLPPSTPPTPLSSKSQTNTLPRGLNGEEIQDEGFNITNARRRSNSSSYAAGLKDFKTKFEQFDPDPVFEENIHGARPEDDLDAATRVTTTESSESGGSGAEGEGKKEV